MLLASLGRFFAGMGGTLLFLLAFQTISLTLADSGEGGSGPTQPLCGNAAICDDGCMAMGIYAVGGQFGDPCILDPAVADWGGNFGHKPCKDDIHGCLPGCDCIQRSVHFPPADPICMCDN